MAKRVIYIIQQNYLVEETFKLSKSSIKSVDINDD